MLEASLGITDRRQELQKDRALRISEVQKAKADFASGVGTFSSERQSSNASLVTGLFGPLATVSKFLKVRLHSHDFLSWHSARKRTTGGFSRGEGGQYGGKAGYIFRA